MPIGDYKTNIIYNECLRFLIICRDFLGNTSLCLLCPTKKEHLHPFTHSYK